MIHANRIVTVGEQESIIDRPIVLYRGDREVEIEFTLVGNEFMFSEEGNVIKSVNASHGQLVLNTPSGENMFSELAECHEGKVVFVVTKEMIDEFIEMGFYSFQIRLYDSAEMKSRVTIPPVMNGFDIRNPIAAEDETNVVDQGIVDYARIFKDQSNEELPTFDWTGAYNKTEWAHHDIITENKMNKIEDALYSINANVKESDVVMLNTLDQVKKDADEYVKEHMAEVEADVDEFERNLNTGVETFKIDTNAAMTAHKNEVSEVVDGFSGEIESINSQLAQIVEYNVVEQGCDNTGAKDCSDILNNLIKSNTTIFFPKGEYLIGKRIVKDLIESVKLYSNGDAILIDGGTEVILEDETSATCPNGILFNNFDGLIIEGINFGNKNTREKGVGKRIKETEEEKRFPVIAFENGKDLKLKNIKTFNTVGSTVATQLNNSIDIYLNAFYIKIKNVKGGEISSIRFDKSTNAGEPLGVYNCECLTINNIKYFQDEEDYYVWSILKLINSRNISVDTITVSSVSNTSLIDVCGKNISINNIKADYPNGKIIDVTLEWGNYNVDSDNIEIKNLTTNGLLVGSTFDGLEKKMNNIIFSNIITNQEIARKRLLLNSRNLKNYVIKDSSFTNISDVNTNHIDESSFIEKNNALITNCGFICDQDIYDNTISFETLGLLKIYNCNIEANGNKISYYDRIGNIFSSDNSIYGEIIIESTTFRNAEILLSSNIKFVNCSFIDCWFTSTSNSIKRNFEINFNNCLFLYNSETIENPFYLIGSGKKYNFTNCKFKGVIIKQADYLFNEVTNYISPLNFVGCEFDVYLNSTTALTVVKASLRSFASPINFINCIFTGKNKVVYFDLDEAPLASSVKKFNVIGCYMERNDVFQSNGTLTTGATGTIIRLGVVGNSVQSSTISKIEGLKGLNKNQQNGNVEL